MEKQVGQLFILGFTGSGFKQSLEKKMRHLHPGALIVFGRNIKSLRQIRDLNFKAQSFALRSSKVPLLIAVDQEGGKVLRIKTSPSLPSARTLALTKNPSLVQEVGHVTGQLMKVLGFNMNLAPVVDISKPHYDDILGNRSFSHQKKIVTKMSQAFSKGLVQAEILPTAKHFPGHGGVKTDSHVMTPHKQITLPELLVHDLAPYQEMQNRYIPFAIMASHISYPLIDPSKKPASLSPFLLKNLLRKNLKFQGILLTDDIQMGGALSHQISIEERAVQAILAGNDLIMVGWNYQEQRKAIKGVLKAVQKGRISRTRIKQSLRRLLSYKMFFYKKPSHRTLRQQIHQIPLKKTYDRIFHEILQKHAISLKNQRVDVYSYSKHFLSNYKKTGKSQLFHLKNFKQWRNHKKTSSIIYHLSGGITKKILQAAPKHLKKKMIVINSSDQLFLRNESDYKRVIHIHSNHPQLGSFVAYHLLQPSY